MVKELHRFRSPESSHVAGLPSQPKKVYLKMRLKVQKSLEEVEL
jgi:hypothetical protein